MFRNFCSTMDNKDYFEEFKPPSLERECIEQECIFAEIYEIANDEREFKNLKNILYGSEAKSNVENFEKFKSDADAGSPRVGSNTPGSGSGPGHSFDRTRPAFCATRGGIMKKKIYKKKILRENDFFVKTIFFA